MNRHRRRILHSFDRAAVAPLLDSARTGDADPSLQYLEAEAFNGKPIVERDLNHLELELAIALGIRDYVRKTAVRNLCLALSGGRDSAMVAWLVRCMFKYEHPQYSKEELDQLVAERFLCAYLATENSSETTREAARRSCA